MPWLLWDILDHGTEPWYTVYSLLSLVSVCLTIPSFQQLLCSAPFWARCSGFCVLLSYGNRCRMFSQCKQMICKSDNTLWCMVYQLSWMCLICVNYDTYSLLLLLWLSTKESFFLWGDIFVDLSNFCLCEFIHIPSV